MPAYFGQAWSIALEFQFYLIFPFLHRFFARYGFAYLFALTGLMLLVRLAVWADHGVVSEQTYYSMLGRLDQFVIGMIAGYFYAAKPFRVSGCYLVLALGAVAVMAYAVDANGGYASLQAQPSPGISWVFAPDIEAGMWALLVLAYLKGRFRLPNRCDNILAYLGKISFSFYLMHDLTLRAVGRQLDAVGHAPQSAESALLWAFFLTFPLTVALSSLTYRLIEQPFFSYRRSYLSRRTQETAV